MIATLAWVAVVIRDLRWRRARSPWRVLAGATAAIAVSDSALVAWKGVDRNGPISFGDTPSARPLAADIVAALGSQRAKDVFQVRVLAYVNDDAALFVELAKQGLSFHVAPEIALFTGTTQATGGPVFLLGTPNTALPSTDHARPVASVGQVAVWESNCNQLYLTQRAGYRRPRGVAGTSASRPRSALSAICIARTPLDAVVAQHGERLPPSPRSAEGRLLSES